MTFTIENNSQRGVLGAAIAICILPTITVFLRMLAGRIAGRSVTSSDVCIIAACIFSVALESVSIVCKIHSTIVVYQCGLGYHVADVVAAYGMDPITKLLKLLIPLQILWALSLSLCKISILLLYSKIFEAGAFTLLARGTAVFVVLWAIGTILAGFLICQPFAYNWDQSIPDGRCGNQTLSFIVTGSFNVVTDVAVLALPLPYLYRLSLPLHQRLIMLGVFGLGFLTCIVSAVRIYALSTMDYSDITFTMPNANIFSGMEPGVAITLACIPLLRPLLTAVKGGHYSATGTVRFGTTIKNNHADIGLRAIERAKSPNASGDRHNFIALEDDSSEYRLKSDLQEYDADKLVRQTSESVSHTYSSRTAT